MKRLVSSCVFTVVLALSFVLTAEGKDMVVNDDFNTMGFEHWTPSGNPHYQWIDYYDVGGTGAGYCLAQWVYTGHNGGLTQEVFVMDGVTYTVLADFAYSNC